MIHSRPGFAPRRSDAAPAKLNDDMIPALHRGTPRESTTLKQNLQSKADAAMAKLAKNHPVPAAPELLVNPAPSATPKVLEPGK
jgi:hypothetical protein